MATSTAATTSTTSDNSGHHPTRNSSRFNIECCLVRWSNGEITLSTQLAFLYELNWMCFVVWWSQVAVAVPVDAYTGQTLNVQIPSLCSCHFGHYYRSTTRSEETTT